MSVPQTVNGQACRSCGVVGAPHGSDADCIAALRDKVDQLNTFVDSLVKQSARRRQALPAPVWERVEGSLSHGRGGDIGTPGPRKPRLRIVRPEAAV